MIEDLLLCRLEELEGKIVLCKDGDEVDLAIGSYAKGILYKTMDLEPYAKVNDQLSVWFKKEEFKKIQDSFAKMRDGIIASGKGIPILSKICRSERINNSDMLIVPDFSGRGPNLIMKDIIKVILHVEVFFFLAEFGWIFRWVLEFIGCGYVYY